MDEYLKKMEMILDNRLEAGGDHQKVITDIMAWLHCEWLCTEMSCEEFVVLKDMVKPLVIKKIKNF